MIIRLLATRMGAGAASLALATALAACGTTNSGTSGSGSAGSAPASSAAPAASQPHNQADISFAQQMIPHHAQAVSMSKLAAQRASSPQVKDLASRIEGAQQPEIDQMSGWLRAWGAAVPDTTDSAMNGMGGMSQHNMPGMDHSSSAAMPGMMSADQMQQLSQANGAAFDTMFLRMMIQHHQGAIAMAKTELAEGANPDAKTLAQNIINAQQREISEMQSMLSRG